MTSLLEKIRRTENLPAQPTVALEVLRLTRDRNASVDDLIRVIQTDASLTARILKIVNSSLYGVPTKVLSVKQAVIALGLRAVQVIAISLSLVDAVRRTEGTRGVFDYPRYWRRTLSTAAGAKLLARRCAPAIADEAFVAGLLSNLGMAAAWHCAPEQYGSVLQAWTVTGPSLVELEKRMLGTTHAEMGEALLRAWGLPDELCRAVGSHHGAKLETLPADADLIARLVQTAELISYVFCRDLGVEAMTPIRERAVGDLSVAPLDLEYVLEEIEPSVRELASVYAVRLSGAVDYQEISADAALRLAELNADSERERAQSQVREREARLEADRLSQANSIIRAAARIDGLTRVANRADFDRRLTKEMDRARRRQQPLALLMIDVDEFKNINDQYGHPAGDRVLRELADCLRRLTDRVGYVARYGGEEFAVIVAQHAAAAVRALAEEIRSTVEACAVRVGDAELRATISIGAACVAPKDEPFTEEALIQAADQSLYQAKQAGRNQVVLAGEEAEESATHPRRRWQDRIASGKKAEPAVENAGEPPVADSSARSSRIDLAKIVRAGRDWCGRVFRGKTDEERSPKA